VMFDLHKTALVCYLGEVNMFFSRMSKNILPAYSSAKIIKIKRVSPEL